MPTAEVGHGGEVGGLKTGFGRIGRLARSAAPVLNCWVVIVRGARFCLKMHRSICASQRKTRRD
jgi:hypothetical protein